MALKFSGTYDVAAAEQAENSVYLESIVCTVWLLDSTCVSFKVDKQCTGHTLLDLTFDYLELLEKDFFGLMFNYPQPKEGNIMKWLDPSKKVRKQFKAHGPYILWFRVKFYVPDPIWLHEEYTRYHFFLQIRKDILDGRLPVPKSLSYHLAGLVLQSELGDYNIDECRPGYVNQFRFVPHQTSEFESQAAEWHRKSSSLLPSDAELEYLNLVRNLDFYGVKIHDVKDEQHNLQNITLGVSFAGLMLFRDQKIINRFLWDYVTRITFKGKRFTIRLKQTTASMNGKVNAISSVSGSNSSSYKDLRNVYQFPSALSAKLFWQYAVGCHAFFRVREPPAGHSNELGSSTIYGSRGTAISATALHAAMSRVVSGFQRYFSISRRDSLSTASAKGPVGGLGRTLSTLMELRRNSRCSDRNISYRRSVRGTFGIPSTTVQNQSVLKTHGSSNSLTTHLVDPVSLGKSHDQAPTGVRSSVKSSIHHHTATERNSNVQKSVIHTGFVSGRMKSSSNLASKDNLFSSTRMTKKPTGESSQNIQVYGPTDKTVRTKPNKSSSPDSTRNSQRKAHQQTSLPSMTRADSSNRPSDAQISFRKSTPKPIQPENFDITLSDNGSDHEFDRDVTQNYWNLRRLQSIGRPQLNNHHRSEITKNMNTNHNNTNIDNNNNNNNNDITNNIDDNYDSNNNITSDINYGKPAELLQGDQFNVRLSKHERPNQDQKSINTEIPSKILRSASHSNSQRHHKNVDGSARRLKEDKESTATNNGFIKDPFHPGAPASETQSYVANESYNSESNMDNLVRIQIRPDSHGRFGFNVKGGVDHGTPIIVSRIGANMPADLCVPRLSEGDQIVCINKKNVAGCTHSEVVEFIRTASERNSGILELMVKPSDYVTDNLNEDDDIPDSGDAPPIPPRSYHSSIRRSHFTLDRLTRKSKRTSKTHLTRLNGISDPIVPVSVSNNSLLKNGIADPLVNSILDLEMGLADGSLLYQFEHLPRKKCGLTMNVSRLTENSIKNRYRDISPYDQTRVVLKHGSNDYINASYVNMEYPECSISLRYIAAQGPLPNTYGDFWQMCLEQQVCLVVMLTAISERGRVKCHQYWPDLNQRLSLKTSVENPTSFKGSTPRLSMELQLQTVREEISTDFAHREFDVSQFPLTRGSMTLVVSGVSMTTIKPMDSRRITQLQYINWPDHGVPEDTDQLISFIKRVQSIRGESKAPIVVHCSAGIGRTGVLIAIETAMNLMKCGQPIKPLELVQHMREHRAMLIQTTSQFQFVCETILRIFHRDYTEKAS